MRALFFSILWVTAVASLARAKDMPLTYLSPDGQLTARIVPTGREAGAKQITNDSASGHGLEYECRVEIYTRQGHKLWEEDFSSPDADHGRGVAFARWSPDSNFFVFSTVSSGGHHPWQYYTYAFSRQKRHLYLLDPLLGEVVEQEFVIAAPDRITLKVLDRKAMERNPNADFPDKKITVVLSQLLDSKHPLSKALLVNPPMRGYYQ